MRRLIPALAAEILTLPSVNEMAELFDIIDPIAIAEVREALTRTLATELADELLAIYNANYQSEYRVEHEDIAKRTLRNACLRFLAFGETHLADVLVSKQFHEANNMTDALAALSAAVAAQLPCRDALMQEYDDKWHQDGLVMDKWFILQATSPRRCAGDGTWSVAASLIYHEQPEPHSFIDWRICGSNPARSMPKMAAVTVPGGNAYRA